MLGLKKSLSSRTWAAKTPPRWRPTWAPLGRQDPLQNGGQLGPPKINFRGPSWPQSWGEVLAALMRHRQFFLEPLLDPLPGPRRPGKKTDCSKDLITKSIFSRPPGSGKGVQQRLQKNSLWRPRAAKTPPKIEANVGLKNRILGAQVGLHFGVGLGGQDAPKLASILEASWQPRRAHRHFC